MTAIVGILNKQAIAVAADSAVTVGGGMKIYNTANKLFTLSKYHPVGVAIYNDASYNSCVPWEVIIKMYRDFIEDTSFPTVKDYATSLFSYLDDFRAKFYKQQDLDAVLSSNVYSFWMANIVQMLPHYNAQSDCPITGDDIGVLYSIIADLNVKLTNAPIINQIKDVTKQEFISATPEVWENIKNQVSAAGESYDNIESSIQETLFLAFTRQKFQHPFFSGLAVFGYGKDEVYPALHEYIIHNMFVNRPYIEERTSVTVGEPPSHAFIHPMAQTDVIKTYIEGISPQIENTFITSTIDILHSTLQTIEQLADSTNKELAQKVRSINLDPVISSYYDTITRFKQDKIVAPLIRTIACMGKEDIAELAENLIYVTSMKRHITPDMESVGGPVDVAVISKGDGFIWMKRKHYFDPKLNNCFFDKYLLKNHHNQNQS